MRSKKIDCIYLVAADTIPRGHMAIVDFTTGLVRLGPVSYTDDPRKEHAMATKKTKKTKSAKKSKK